MKIAMVVARYHPFGGGIESHVRAISERLVMDGFEVEVLTTDPMGILPRESVLNGVRIKHFKSWAPNDSYFFSHSIINGIRKSEASIMHAHGYYSLTSPEALLFSGGFKCSFLTLHSGGSSSQLRKALRHPYNLVMGQIARRANKIICVSGFELDSFQKILRLPESRFELIPNGVELHLPKQMAPTLEKEKPPILLATGRSDKYKGTERVLRSFKKFNTKYPGVHLKLYILGNALYNSGITKELHNLGIHEQVKLFGWVSDEEYASILGRASMFILLSDYEGGPIAVSEAIASGTPPILAENSAMEEFVRNGLAIGVRNPEDEDEVAEKIYSLLQNPSKYQSKTYRPLSWEDTVNRLKKVYETCAN